MRYVEALNKPELFDTHTKLFLAGGITNCPDWQKTMVSLLANTNLTILNPRRADFPIGDPNAAQKQIKWEYDALREADIIQFWFPADTLCPIVLYELGAWSARRNIVTIGYKSIFIGIEPGYKREQDVVIQTGLVRPEIEIVYSLEELAIQIKGYRLGSCGDR